MEVINGIDVSHYQGNIDWDQVKDDPLDLKFAFYKVTEGNWFIDDQGENNLNGTKQINLSGSGYHFWRGQVSGKDQALYFMDHTEKREQYPVIDVEDVRIYSLLSSSSRDYYLNNIYEYVDTIYAKWNQPTILYTAKWYWNRFGTQIPSWVRDCPLWVAHYKAWGDLSPYMPIGWNNWTIWQYSASGRVNGIGNSGTSVDMNIMLKSNLSKIVPNTTPTNTGELYQSLLIKLDEAKSLANELYESL